MGRSEINKAWHGLKKLVTNGVPPTRARNIKLPINLKSRSWNHNCAQIATILQYVVYFI